MRRLLAVVAALALAVCVYAGTVQIPDDLQVIDDLDVDGDVDIDGNSNVGGTASFSDFSCGHILQRYLIIWNESAESGAAWPDTFINAADRFAFIAPCDGTIEDVILYMHLAESSWDTLHADVYNASAGDTSVLSVTPCLTIACSDESNSETCSEGTSRAAVVDATTKSVTAGDVIFVSARTYGDTLTSPPKGVMVEIVFEPDY